MTNLAKLKKELDDKVFEITESHGQKVAEMQAEKYLDGMTPDHRTRMENVVEQLLACNQQEFFDMWFPIVDLCLTKNYKVYSRVDRALGYLARESDRVTQE